MTATNLTDPKVRYRSENTVIAALKNPKILLREALAGLVVSLALIPEAIAFSVIAGVDPKVGLVSAFIMTITIAITGGRPAMITSATGAVALVVAPLSQEYGMHYLVATIILAGIIQILLSIFGVSKLMRFIPQSVMTGFVNALAIMLLVAQLPELISVPWATYLLVAIGVIIILLMPKITTVIPAPLVSIVVLTAIVIFSSVNVVTVGDKGALPTVMPKLFFLNIPFTWDTLTLIGPYAIAVALVGLMETLMTAKLVDDITDTHSNKTREGIGQGIANIASALFGGMGGCAVIGQTMINVKASRARTRISTFLAGVFLCILLLGFGDIVAKLPMAALVAVMITVSIDTFNWHSIQPSTIKRLPKSETITMVITVIFVLATNNLAIGVIIGVLVASVFFVRDIAHLVEVHRRTDEVNGEEVARYKVDGPLLFASSHDLTTMFEYTKDPNHVIIDFTDSHIWDASSVGVLDAVQEKYRKLGKSVEFIGMNKPTTKIHETLTGTINAD